MLGLGIPIRINKRSGGDSPSPPSYDPDAQAYMTAGGFTTTGAKTIINDWVVYLKDNSLWSKILVDYMDFTELTSGTNAEKFDQMKFNLVNPLDTDAAYRMTAVNSPTSDINGVDFNGTTQYLNTHVDLSTAGVIELNNITSICYTAENTFTTTSLDAGIIDGSEQFYSGGNFNNVVNYAAMNETGSNLGSQLNLDAMISQIRESSTTFKQRRNGVLVNTVTKTTSGFPDGKIYRGALNNAGSPSNYSNRKQIHYTIGKFTEAELALMETGINNLQGDIDTLLGTSRKRY